MYPNEPETTYIDLADVIKERQSNSVTMPSKSAEEKKVEELAKETEAAIKAVEAWSKAIQETNNGSVLDLKSSLAFELLD